MFLASEVKSWNVAEEMIANLFKKWSLVYEKVLLRVLCAQTEAGTVLSTLSNTKHGHSVSLVAYPDFLGDEGIYQLLIFFKAENVDTQTLMVKYRYSQVSALFRLWSPLKNTSETIKLILISPDRY